MRGCFDLVGGYRVKWGDEGGNVLSWHSGTALSLCVCFCVCTSVFLCKVLAMNLNARRVTMVWTLITRSFSLMMKGKDFSCVQ